MLSLFTNTSLSPQSNLFRITADQAKLLPLCDIAYAWFSHCGTNTPHRGPFRTSFPFILELRSYFKIDSFSTNTQISNLMELRPVGAEMFHDGGHDKANNRSFAVLPARLKTARFLTLQ